MVIGGVISMITTKHDTTTDEEIQKFLDEWSQDAGGSVEDNSNDSWTHDL